MHVRRCRDDSCLDALGTKTAEVMCDSYAKTARYLLSPIFAFVEADDAMSERQEIPNTTLSHRTKTDHADLHFLKPRLSGAHHLPHIQVTPVAAFASSS